jgi:lysophospholipase L1-like esterase
MPPSRTRSWLRIVVGVAIGMGVMEAVIRQIWWHQRVDVPGYVKIGTPGTRTVWRTEGSGITHRDENGYRVGYAANAPKVLVLGDSYTEALEVNDDEVYTYLAQQRLEAEGIELALVNGGTAGRSTADYVAFAERHRQLVHPVWTVITLRDDDLGADALAPGKTRFVRGGDGKLAPFVDEPRTAPGLRDLIWNNPSILVRYTFFKFHRLGEEAEKDPPLFRAGSAGADVPAREDAVAPAEAPVEEIVDQVSAAWNGRFTIVNLPYLDFGPARIRPVETTRRLFEYCAKRGISCIEPTEEFLRLARKNRSPYGFSNTGFNYGHMNVDGHAAVGEALARELARLRRDGLL